MKDSHCFKKSEWFFEDLSNASYDEFNTSIGIRIKKKLYEGKSPFQRIGFFDTYPYGKILVLDGIIQTSEKDEFIYHEMLCQVPMLSHPDPKRVLIMGGGDGGSLEEVLKHSVEKVVMVEIDKKVVDLSKKYLTSISKGAFDNKKAELIIGDGKEVIKKHKDFFDVIILDLSDPDGPAKELISSNFYKDVKCSLRKNGLTSIQSGSFICQSKMTKRIYSRIKKIFPHTEIRKAVVPVYQAGEYSFTLGSKYDLRKLTIKDLERRFKKMKLGLKYYSPEIHFSSKVLPRYLAEGLKK